MTAKRTMILRLAAAGYTAAVVTVTLLPSGPNAPAHWDSGISSTVQAAGHIAAYALLVVLWTAALARRTLGGLALLALAAAAFGGLLEAAQALSPTRTPSVWDALRNTLGASLGWVIMQAASLRSTHRIPAAPETH